jgi:aminodeoxyfutalosine synthase
MENALTDLEKKASAGDALTRAEAERVMACADLVPIGMLGAAARRAKHGNRVTYGRVCTVHGAALPAERGDAGEVRIFGTPASPEDAMAWTRAAAAFAAGAVVTGFSLADLVTVSGGDHLVLVELAKALKAGGLDSVAEVPLDRLGDDPAEIVRAVLHGGLAARRATIEVAAASERLDLIERAAAIQRETGAFSAFAPLPRIDPVDAPSTGYDDVKTIAVARVLCPAIAHIQVDWPLYGPKLAQVAIEYGADDIDGVSSTDTLQLGHRRSPKEDIERQIRSAFAVPAERSGRYEPRT